MTTQLTLFQDKPAQTRKHKPVSQKWHRRHFWAQRTHVNMKDPHYLKTLSPDGLRLTRDYRLYLRIPGYYTLFAVLPADYWEYMIERRIRLWKLVSGYDKRGNKAKADYYYSLYQSHTYHL